MKYDALAGLFVHQMLEGDEDLVIEYLQFRASLGPLAPVHDHTIGYLYWLLGNIESGNGPYAMQHPFPMPFCVCEVCLPLKAELDGWIVRGFPEPLPIFDPGKKATWQIYLIRNKRNGHVKIGRSTNPRVRERTLQAEESDLEMLFHFPGGKVTEKGLHERFSEKRVRGEWFALDASDIETLRAAHASL